MTQIMKRALPFIMTFVFGVAITAIIGRVSPVPEKRFLNNGCSRIKWKSQTVQIWELHNPAEMLHIPMIVRDSSLPGLTLKEQALLARAQQNDAPPGPRFVVGYVSPDTIDGGGPYTSNVQISNIPRPAFWDKRQDNKQVQVCNTLVRVDLDASGKVSRVEPVRGYGDQCPHISDILNAAREISFSPALREGVPVTLRMSMMYRAR